MNKLSIAVLVAGTAAVTGFIVSKVMKNKKKCADSEFFDEDYNDCCCDSCACEEDLDVVIPAEEADDCVEAVGDAAENAAEETAEENKDTAEDSAEEAKD